MPAPRNIGVGLPGNAKKLEIEFKNLKMSDGFTPYLLAVEEGKFNVFKIHH